MPLPPGPKQLPLIGNIHQVIGVLPHQSLASLAKKYGPLMHLQLGEVTLVVISSPDVAKEILKDQEHCFAQRPEITANEILSYANASLILDRIISNHEVKLRSNTATYSEDVVDVLLKQQQTSDLNFPITMNVIKDVIMSEVRAALKGKTRIKESDIQNLEYLKNIVKETLRLHPPGTLMPKEATEECTVRGYRMPRKAKVVFNLSVFGRDLEYWSDPESFKPERFEETSIDFRGGSFEYLPFGGWRRICPGINFALANIELPLAQLLYHFDWETADGKKPEELDMTESFGITSKRKNDLVLFPTIVIVATSEEGDVPGELD
ncbi:hypothetical protein MLD38_019497 [Melastoma candidum]|uniref:Uncharacterized protein n=1 Tax=Melastoma candidum TaxID=119954 RepID=A0ACB9QX73_9MYRT|nr:hypothetical protein MLD38_019497 [Melastoma candidum]